MNVEKADEEKGMHLQSVTEHRYNGIAQSRLSRLDRAAEAYNWPKVTIVVLN